MPNEKFFEIIRFRQRSSLVGFVEFHAIARVEKGVKTRLGRKGLSKIVFA
jgi:hypothetical protein